MSSVAVELLDRKLARARDAHASALLRVLNDALEVIQPYRPATVADSLAEFEKGTAQAQRQFGEAVRTELLSLVEQARIRMTPELKESLLGVVAKYVDRTIYTERFHIFEEALDRHVRRYETSINLAGLPVDLTRAKYEAGSSSFTGRLMAVLADDLEAVVLRDTQANRVIKLEPSFHGISINLSELIRSWRSKGK